MESWMHANQQVMSQEQVRDATLGTGTGPGTRRSYDCTFCKHGFTNAQALGGHMNIHRKDRAKKNKRKGQSSTAPHQHQTAYNNVIDDHNGNREHYQYQNPVSVPMSEPLPAAGFDAQGSYLYWPSNTEMPDQPPYGAMDDVSAGLSLAVGSRPAEEHYGYGVVKGDDDVDLELRL